MNILKPTIVLFMVTLVCGLLLGGVDSYTRDAITAQGVIELNKNLIEIFSENEEFEKLETDKAGPVISCYQASTNGSSAGYIMETRPMGYAGEIVVLTGINLDGTVRKVKILSMSETPGLGAVAQTDVYLGQYAGKSAGIGVSKSAPSGNEIAAITSATVTSVAVTKGVNDSLDFFNTNIKGGK